MECRTDRLRAGRSGFIVHERGGFALAISIRRKLRRSHSGAYATVFPRPRTASGAIGFSARSIHDVYNLGDGQRVSLQGKLRRCVGITLPLPNANVQPHHDAGITRCMNR